MTELLSSSFEETLELGFKIGKVLKPGDIVALNGDLGAGKTSISKGIARALGIKDVITSPTYTIVSEYEGTIPLYHMDMYRIDGIEEFELLGVDELLFGQGVSLIEWSERITEYLPDDCKTLNISILENGQRKISLEGIEL
ncbi:MULTISPECIES: tRNA (adenosine(37)-N6)-threonylcarbamoyltransferase complex ATPase subunit type 1 TsaE [unclassified Oceanispirochaeta]|uniref:tRNA (adenosine(37)-N6)-threonylcarbamoyltransferase complex ATPase subunit type 1 TsaE n=1 Tax=unclassified Oceanispirochaeta TaxID=2635722 RepID=UPI000E09B1CD|nr:MULTISPECIES: tRNA (adenosine(37)-N6)-threonylcarbamoyltransferase complex ATPase subunit type 1 TsaE [unclassified Oceanispirochaeta]MBF9014825.1 tRNA (adenosine(37)-N6)-threonylcarbamoyltransferase complex ATPase subunit type 1 TsaE [Oceanispirochaeta sp. M2]NPD71081.1 tRNA (adenosine(37)-N6)-threonylcarbamoyltransferase complex ATPase subunit type 1 TsaE [Oceanispirochaeta sp. M1]RDG33913.1 tRNA (adenosine(37)-N6)-threonylcarbamoyltransferase complex ATPase subunit type 1 TsaE [Oceanispiro